MPKDLNLVVRDIVYRLLKMIDNKTNSETNGVFFDNNDENVKNLKINKAEALARRRSDNYDKYLSKRCNEIPKVRN